MREAPPGPWLRLMALGASAATLLAVISGAASLGAAHQLLVGARAAAARRVLVAAWLGHRRLVVPALPSIALFGLAALITVDGLHLAAAAIAFASTLVLAALTFRGEPAPLGPWRDYVTLTKPRIMSLLLLTGVVRDVRRRAGRAAPRRSWPHSSSGSRSRAAAPARSTT